MSDTNAKKYTFVRKKGTGARMRASGIGLSEEQKWQIASVSVNLAARKQERGFWQFFSFNGRACRKEYWLLLPLAFLVFTCTGFLFNLCKSEVKPERVITIGSCILLFMTLPVCVRRLHDLNLSGMVILIKMAINFFCIALMASAHFLLMFELTSAEDEDEAQIPFWVVMDGRELPYGLANTKIRTLRTMKDIGVWIYYVCDVAWLIILGFMPGTVGKNNYGKDPFGRMSATEIAVSKMKRMESEMRREIRNQLKNEMMCTNGNALKVDK